MTRPRLDRVLDAIADGDASAPLPARLCSGAAQMLNAPGIGIALVAGGDLRSICSTEPGRRGEELQTELGEGPSYDAHEHGWPVLVADLEIDDSWPAFGEGALASGIRSVFAFPLRSGAILLGAFDLYREAVGELTDDQHADALVFAQVAVDLLVTLQTEAPDELHELLAGRETEGWQVHQASGMLSIQLGVTVIDALALLRARAYASGRPLDDVVADVVDRRLRWDVTA